MPCRTSCWLQQREDVAAAALLVALQQTGIRMQAKKKNVHSVPSHVLGISRKTMILFCCKLASQMVDAPTDQAQLFPPERSITCCTNALQTGKKMRSKARGAGAGVEGWLNRSSMQSGNLLFSVKCRIQRSKGRIQRSVGYSRWNGDTTKQNNF